MQDEEPFGIPDPIVLKINEGLAIAETLGLTNIENINVIGEWVRRVKLDRMTGGEGLESIDSYLSLTDRKRLIQRGNWKAPKKTCFIPEAVLAELKLFDDTSYEQQWACFAVHACLKILSGNVSSDEEAMWLHQMSIESLNQFKIQDAKNYALQEGKLIGKKELRSDDAAHAGKGKGKSYSNKKVRIRQWVDENPSLHRLKGKEMAKRFLKLNPGYMSERGAADVIRARLKELKV